MKQVPEISADVILHEKDTDMTERLIFPVTRYHNILNAPGIVRSRNDLVDAPFTFMTLESEELTYEQIFEFCGAII